MTTPVPQPVPSVRLLSPREGYSMFDDLVRKTLGISADAFIERWKAGEFDWDQSPDIDNLMSLLPLALHLDEQ